MMFSALLILFSIYVTRKNKLARFPGISLLKIGRKCQFSLILFAHALIINNITSFFFFNLTLYLKIKKKKLFK